MAPGSRPAETPVYIAVYKPVGVLSSTISQGGKPTILDVVDVPKRVFPVGRLDVDSEGLMLLTNDGRADAGADPSEVREGEGVPRAA